MYQYRILESMWIGRSRGIHAVAVNYLGLSHGKLYKFKILLHLFWLKWLTYINLLPFNFLLE